MAAEHNFPVPGAQMPPLVRQVWQMFLAVRRVKDKECCAEWSGHLHEMGRAQMELDLEMLGEMQPNQEAYYDQKQEQTPESDFSLMLTETEDGLFDPEGDETTVALFNIYNRVRAGIADFGDAVNAQLREPMGQRSKLSQLAARVHNAYPHFPALAGSDVWTAIKTLRSNPSVEPA